ncbi:MAG TPA: hypothetical protein VG757_01195 [Devosia sp.]|nr:hypothetical protein [Devosia sp.]
MRYFRGLWRRIGLAIFVIGLALSPNVWMSAKVLRLAGEGMLAEYRLSLIPLETYAEEIGKALHAGDGDLARSLMALANDRKVAIPDDLAVRVATLPPFDALNALGQGWNCIVNGDFDSEAGFACVVATDLTGIGDARDLIGEGTHYLTGQPVNYLTLGVASVGLTLTGATIATGGGMLPLRAGASFLKGMNKAAKLPPRLVAEIGGVLARGVNGAALDETLVLARSFRFGEIGRPLGRLLNPKSVKVVSELATDFGTIGKVGGVRAMKLSAGVAESTRDVKVLAKTATRFQDRFLGVMKLAGRGAVRLADLIWTLGGWLVGAALWLLSMAWFMLKSVTRMVRFVGRLMRPRARARRQIPAGALVAAAA